MHDLTGQTLLYDREHHVFLGNSLELTVTRDRAQILIGPFAKDAPKEQVIFTTASIVHAFLILAQVIEEQGGVTNQDAVEADQPRKRAICAQCEGYGGFDDRDGNWTECGKCHGAGTCPAT